MKVTMDRIMAAAESSMFGNDSDMGFCLACGEEQNAEPDARRQECDACGASKVYGAEELLLMLVG
jgi:NADH pyrophosphatase NudC (nudix superfamily)